MRAMWVLGGAILTGMATSVERFATPGWEFIQLENERAVEESGTPERTIDDPGSLEGATPDEVEALVPKGWVKSPSRTGDGTRWLNPDRPGEAVRVQPGNQRDPNPVKRGPYARVSKNGKTTDPIPLRGNPTLPQR